MLLLKEITKSYNSAHVLNSVTLSCESNVAICLAGANAAGKTTLLQIAAGLQKADSGEILCDGTLGFVPQQSALLEDLSVRENLMLWYAACGRSNREIFSETSVEKKLGLTSMAKKSVKNLSGGYRKRADIACALAKNPDYLLMDEPFTALDLVSRQEITLLLCQLREQGKGLLFSSHDPDAIAGIANRMVVLQGGTIIREEALDDAQQSKTQIVRLLTQL